MSSPDDPVFQVESRPMQTTLDRRQFLAGAGALAVSVRSAIAESPAAQVAAAVQRPAIFPASVRADFPSVASGAYMNSAAMHPLGKFAARAVESGVNFRLHGPGEGREDFTAAKQQDLKARYATLIGATANEIAFTGSTSDGENIVVMGMDLPRKGGNVVIDELHFTTSLYMYKELEKKGVELRIVKHRDWKIDLADMDRAIDRNTRLVSLALVSNVNGYMHDCKSVSALAHGRGAYVFADIIQAVGAVPVDMRGLGIDFASAGTYKWLMGERGFGFLYVREDLQGTVLPTTRYGHRQVTNFNRAELTWEPLPGAARYETGGIPVLLAAAVSEGINYVQSLGIDKVRTHARMLTDRLQQELPRLGYKPLTPEGTETPILAFALPDAAATARALQAGKVIATIVGNESRLRLSVSVFNTHDDIDRVVQVLGGHPTM
jgi:selenocysteine lyase/cysteine desulfurase